MNPSDLIAIEAVLRVADSQRRSETHADEILERFDEMDRRLTAAGFPPTSPWWREQIARWYGSGRRRLVARVGRRGGKSSTLSRLAVVEAVYGHHKIPPGDTGVVAVVSTTVPEADDRLNTIKAILDALAIPWAPWGKAHGIKLVGRRIGIRVFAATIAGVSGFTGIFLLLDEVAKWKDKNTGANPASEVIASIKPTVATQPNARTVMSSSPFGMLDAHFDAFEEGETAEQVVAQAPTWVANPTLTEEFTRGEEKDYETWLREYAAIPQAEVEASLLTELLVDGARRHPPQPWDLPWEEGRRYVATMDPATRRNVWTLVIATQRWDGTRTIVLAREWRPQPGMPLRSSTVLAEIALLIRPYGLRCVYTDQHAVDQLAELGTQAGLVVLEAAWTETNKRDAYEHVRMLLTAQPPKLEVHPDPQVKADLLGIKKVITRAGVRYELAEIRGRHSDYAPAVAMAVDDSRWRGRPTEEQLDDEEAQQVRKKSFLEARAKQAREESRRKARMPVTHRRR